MCASRPAATVLTARAIRPDYRSGESFRHLAAASAHEESYRLALAAGVPVMLGSDVPPFWKTGGTSATVRELEHMETFGLSPRDALLAATRVPAAWLGIDGEVGSVEALFEAGATRVEFGTPHGLTAARGIELLGRRVLPAVLPGLPSAG